MTSRRIERRRRREAGRGDSPERIAEKERTHDGEDDGDVGAATKRASGALVANGASFNG